MDKLPQKIETEHYIEEYSEERYWDKLKRFAKTAGWEIIEKSLWLYYAAQKPETPMWAKTVIYSALGYFILPADLIPDMIPAVGFADDLGALTIAIASIAVYIDANVKEQTQKKLQDWFEL
ncbi:MAG: DUF1232 domain-containing protein [Gammaproteobacteria bacterium]|nr:DUF1232 domain-containing protein [Gammaproteobacteria bacterium]